MVTAWVFTIPSAALLAAAAWEISDLFSSSAAGSVVIALIAAAGAFVLFKLAQRSKITPDELDRTTITPETDDRAAPDRRRRRTPERTRMSPIATATGQLERTLEDHPRRRSSAAPAS